MPTDQNVLLLEDGGDTRDRTSSTIGLHWAQAARILRQILAANSPVPGLAPRDRKWALELAISLLDGRTLDAEASE